MLSPKTAQQDLDYSIFFEQHDMDKVLNFCLGIIQQISKLAGATKIDKKGMMLKI